MKVSFIGYAKMLNTKFMKFNPSDLSPEQHQAIQAARRAFQKQLTTLPDKGVEGFFGPGSASWQLYREPLIFVGGIRALLLQIAHPAVADGVHRFSNFQEDALERGRRTFKAMAKIYFADAGQARATALQLFTIHSYIQGVYNARAFKKSYTATDPDLALWVLATLIDTTYVVFDEVYGGISTSVQHQFYEESKITAALMGIPATHYPPTLADFKNYFQGMLTGDILRVDGKSYALAQAILHNRHANSYLSELLALAFLPQELCLDFGVKPSLQKERHIRWLLKTIKISYGLMPSPLRYSPAYHQAQYRIAQARNQPSPLLGRCYDWLSHRMHIPLSI